MAGEITLAEIQARVPPDTWSRVFDADGNGSTDTTFAQAAVDSAIADAEMRLQAFLPDYLATKSGAVNAAIKVRLAAMTLYFATYLNPSAGGSEKEPGPFTKAYKEACEFFSRLARDDQNRLTDGTQARPVASVTNSTNNGAATNVFTRSADGTDPSMF